MTGAAVSTPQVDTQKHNYSLKTDLMIVKKKISSEYLNNPATEKTYIK